MASNSLVLLCMLLVAALPTAFSDIQANCTYEDLLGAWEFHVGPAIFNNSIDCSKPFSPVKVISINLVFPIMAVDQFGNLGSWTIVYNQGAEVKIGGKIYFAFSNFTRNSNGSFTSYCRSTLPGWSHDTWGHNWACYIGKKISDGRISGLLASSRDKKLLSQKELDLERKYVANPSFIKEINSRQTLWRAAIYPELSDMTFGERLKRAGGVPKYNHYKYPLPAAGTFEVEKVYSGNIPDHLDWRNVNGINFVSPVRHQGNCSSGYAMATLAMLEARIRMATNNSLQVVLSPQDVVSCSEYTQGCEGGFPYLSAKYVEDFGVLEESCFPYLGKAGKSCNEKPECMRYYSTDHHYVGDFYGGCNEPLMQLEIIRMGPMVASFNVYQDFLAYKGGIYQHTGLEDKFNPWEVVGHAVLVVGYGEEAGVKYWIVKNSWGRDWGEEGYFRILRGVDECGIENMASVASPIVP